MPQPELLTAMWPSQAPQGQASPLEPLVLSLRKSTVESQEMVSIQVHSTLFRTGEALPVHVSVFTEADGFAQSSIPTYDHLFCTWSTHIAKLSILPDTIIFV